jgi:hypothetical protein
MSAKLISALLHLGPKSCIWDLKESKILLLRPFGKELESKNIGLFQF